MIGILICFGVFTALGIYLVACDALKIPTFAPTKAALNIAQHEKRHAKSLDALVLHWAYKLSKFIKLSDYKHRKMTATLKSADIPLTPETFIAKSIVKAFIWLCFAIFMYFIEPLLAPVIMMWMIKILFDDLKSADTAVKKKREEIEYELPRFVATISQELRSNRDVLSMLEGYRASAGKGFKSELEITIADMKSGPQETALTRLETRIGSAMLSEVVRGLLAVLQGDNGILHFDMLAHDYKQLEYQRLKLIASKRPDKVRKYSYAILVCFIIIIFYVIGVQAYNSMYSMF